MWVLKEEGSCCCCWRKLLGKDSWEEPVEQLTLTRLPCSVRWDRRCEHTTLLAPLASEKCTWKLQELPWLWLWSIKKTHETPPWPLSVTCYHSHCCSAPGSLAAVSIPSGVPKLQSVLPHVILSLPTGLRGMDCGSFLISICPVSDLSLNVYIFPTFSVLHYMMIALYYYILAIYILFCGSYCFYRPIKRAYAVLSHRCEISPTDRLRGLDDWPPDGIQFGKVVEPLAAFLEEVGHYGWGLCLVACPHFLFTFYFLKIQCN